MSLKKRAKGEGWLSGQSTASHQIKKGDATLRKRLGEPMEKKIRGRLGGGGSIRRVNQRWGRKGYYQNLLGLKSGKFSLLGLKKTFMELTGGKKIE